MLSCNYYYIKFISKKCSLACIPDYCVTYLILVLKKERKTKKEIQNTITHDRIIVDKVACSELGVDIVNVQSIQSTTCINI